ncbi:MAG TPA: ATP-binding protein [Polyangia bacterium]|nr:ATP-binding protein [Polyangia bacterium]
MRTSAGVVIGLVALVAIVGTALSSATVEQERVLSDFTAEAGRQVGASAAALSRLDSLHQDIRMLADMVERSLRAPGCASTEVGSAQGGRRGRPTEPSQGSCVIDPGTERRVWESAFRALAVVVVHYRVIGLVDADGRIEVLAVDPTEPPATADVLLPQVRTLGAAVAAAGAERLGAPAHVGDRSLLLYATPVRGGGAIVVVSDAALLLRAVAWPQLAGGRLFVTDPAGVVWSGCETAAGCRPSPAAAAETLRGARGRTYPLDAREAERLGLFPASALRVSEPVARPTGNWLVTWIASAQPVMARERGALLRILTTAISAAVVVAAVGLILFRQERRAVELANQLRYAQALAQAREMENQLVRADRLITVGVMATEIAHEIGTPLSVVRGRAEQVLRRVDGTPGGEDLRVVIKQVDQISSTVRQLLDFSRRSPLEKRAVPLAPVVERSRELLQLKLEARRLQMDLDLSEDLPMLTADADQLQQVLVNLLLNACDASPPGQRVRLSARRAPGDMVRIAVADRGTGIPPENLTAIFEPFFTTKPRGEGTGLGLAIAAGIVRNHAGQIDVQSAVGEGTTVTVLWPATPEAALPLVQKEKADV